LIGANRSYLMQVIPHIANLMVADIAEAVSWAETIVTTVPDPVYETGVASVRPDQTVLNFARFSSEHHQSEQEGFLW
jgi:GDP-mannose 6-dehydrogenase